MTAAPSLTMSALMRWVTPIYIVKCWVRYIYKYSMEFSSSLHLRPGSLIFNHLCVNVSVKKSLHLREREVHNVLRCMCDRRNTQGWSYIHTNTILIWHSKSAVLLITLLLILCAHKIMHTQLTLVLSYHKFCIQQHGSRTESWWLELINKQCFSLLNMCIHILLY